MEGEIIMVLDKIQYINAEENNEAGQKSDGTWYIKSLKFKDKVDLEQKIVECNMVLNKLNHTEKLKFKNKKTEKVKK